MANKIAWIKLGELSGEDAPLIYRNNMLIDYIT